MEISKVEIVFTPLSEIQEADRNVKDHDIGSIHESMNRFGFTSPLLMNEKTGKLVAGHGRIETLKQKKQFNESPPSNIQVDEETKEYYLKIVVKLLVKDTKLYNTLADALYIEFDFDRNKKLSENITKPLHVTFIEEWLAVNT